MNRNICTILLVFISANIAKAQTEFAKEFYPLYEKGLELTLEVAEAMPDSLYSFKPEEGAKSFGEQIIHGTYGFDALIDIYVMGNKEREYNPPDATKMTKTEIIEAVKKYSKISLENLNKLTEKQLPDSINIFGKYKTTKKEAFYFLRDHMTNHRAKANLYIRLNGLKPPSWGYFK